MSENNGYSPNNQPIDFRADFDQDVNGQPTLQSPQPWAQQGAQAGQPGQPNFAQHAAQTSSAFSTGSAAPAPTTASGSKRGKKIVGIALAVVAGLALQGGLIAVGTGLVSNVIENQAASQIAEGPLQMGQQSSSTPTKKQSKGVMIIDTTGPSGGGSGTGMVISEDGKILTNYHVVKGSTQIRVTEASTGKSYTAELVGHDAVSDVALLKVDAKGLDTVSMNGDGVSVGQKVTTVGNASGGGKLVASEGQVSAVGQRINVGDQAGGSQQTLLGMIRTTTGAVPGDSGGPTFNEKNEVIGITSAAASENAESTETTSFVIPINYAMDIAKKIENNQASDTIKIGPKAKLGVVIRDASDGYNSIGALVAQVSDPASSAGIQAGDVIVGVNGTKVRSASSLTSIIEQFEPGQEITVDVLSQENSTQNESGETRMSDFTQKTYRVTLDTSDIN